MEQDTTSRPAYDESPPSHLLTLEEPSDGRDEVLRRLEAAWERALDELFIERLAA
jgi:hypothetical protein